MQSGLRLLSKRQTNSSFPLPGDTCVETRWRVIHLCPGTLHSRYTTITAEGKTWRKPRPRLLSPWRVLLVKGALTYWSLCCWPEAGGRGGHYLRTHCGNQLSSRGWRVGRQDALSRGWASGISGSHFLSPPFRPAPLIPCGGPSRMGSTCVACEPRGRSCRGPQDWPPPLAPALHIFGGS